MITVVSLNPCIDKTIVIEDFEYGGYNSVLSTNEYPSGKGINVSIGLKNLGVDCKCIWLKHKNGGILIENKLNSKNIENHYVDIEGTIRTNIKLFNAIDCSMTELNETGVSVALEITEKISKLFKEQVEGSGYVILTGSIPLGITTDIYYKLSKLFSKETKLILDSDGELLKETLKATPFFIKPNLYELSVYAGKELKTISEILNTALKIIEQGINFVIVSMGEDGAIITNGKESYFSKGSESKVKALQGAGDSMVAGACLALKENLPLNDILRYSIAFAQTTIELPGSEIGTKENFFKKLDLTFTSKL